MSANQTYVRCALCGHDQVVPTASPADRSLAISVMDHRNKFQGSSILSMWFAKYGSARPEDIFPDLEGFDIEAYFAEPHRV